MRPKRLLVAILALAMTSCIPAVPQASSLVYGLTLAPSGIDPHVNASSELTIPLTSVYDTLVYQDPQSGQVVPGLAERWTLSDDGLTYTFFLRSDVAFHDGTPFNAEAVRANLEYVLNPDNHSQKAIFMLGPLQEVQVIDEATVALHLSEPYAPLLDSLSQAYLGMASPDALRTWGPTDYQFHQVGSGPYRLVEYVPNDHLTLARNTEYRWAPVIFRTTQAAIDDVIFRFYEDPATRALALESGEVDVVGEVPPRDAERLVANGDFQLYPVAIPGMPLQFFFNTLKPPTDDLLVRQALIQAVDREFIVSTVFGSFSPVAIGPLTANSFGFAPQFPVADYNLEQARQELEQAGWKDEDGDGLRSKQGTPLELLIVVPPWGSGKEVAQLIAADWEQVGANVTIEVPAAFGLLKEAQGSGEYNAIAFNLFGTDPDQLQAFYASDGLYNWSGYTDPTIDELLQQGRQAVDRQEREGVYAQLASMIRDQALQLPIRDYVNLVVASTRVQDLRFSYQGWAPLLFDLDLAP